MIGGFLALSLLLPSAPPAAPATPAQPGLPRAVGERALQKGDELTFTGTVDEAVERPGNQFRRSQKLEIRVLVLATKESWTDVAVLRCSAETTTWWPAPAGTITGGTPEKAAQRRGAARPGSGPRRRFRTPLASDQHAAVRPRFQNAGPHAAAHSARLVRRVRVRHVPARARGSAPDKPWNVASTDPNRSPETWHAQGHEFVTAERCTYSVMNQQHPNWAKPVGGQSAWHRARRGVGVPDRRHRAEGTPRDQAPRRHLARFRGVGGSAIRTEGPDAGDEQHLRPLPARDVEVAFAASAEVAPRSSRTRSSTGRGSSSRGCGNSTTTSRFGRRQPVPRSGARSTPTTRRRLPRRNRREESVAPVRAGRRRAGAEAGRVARRG